MFGAPIRVDRGGGVDSRICSLWDVEGPWVESVLEVLRLSVWFVVVAATDEVDCRRFSTRHHGLQLITYQVCEATLASELYVRVFNFVGALPSSLPPFIARNYRHRKRGSLFIR
jgi:hypothetical protein